MERCRDERGRPHPVRDFDQRVRGAPRRSLTGAGNNLADPLVQAPMGGAEQYRRNAEEADRRAKLAFSTIEREAYEKIAKEWRAMAAEAERKALGRPADNLIDHHPQLCAFNLG